MKVIAPFFTIQDELDTRSLAERIEACGRVCYKSEEKITPTSAEPFVRSIVKREHNSVLEMAVLTLRVTTDSDSIMAKFLEGVPKYLFIDRLERRIFLITGSVRAFREFYRVNPGIKLAKAITAFLSERHPLLFGDLVPKHGWVLQEGIIVEKVPLSEVEKLPAGVLGRHRHVGVKFTVNRAVTHEIVRHRPCSFLQESQRYCRYAEDKFGNQVPFIKPMFFAEGSEEYAIWRQAMEETERHYLRLLETSSPQAARTVLPNSCKTELIVYTNLVEWLHIFKLRTSAAAEPSMREVMIPLLKRFQIRYPTLFEGIAVED